MIKYLLSILTVAAGIFCQASAQVRFTDPVSSELTGPLVQAQVDDKMTILTVVVPSFSNFRTVLESPISGALGTVNNVSLQRPSIGLTYILGLNNPLMFVKPLLEVAIGPSNLVWRAAANVDYQRLFLQFGIRGSSLAEEGTLIHNDTRVQGLVVLMLIPQSSVEVSTVASTNQRASYETLLTYRLSPYSNIAFGFAFPPDGHTIRSLAFSIVF